jgi:PAS domain S-box-containing protein
MLREEWIAAHPDSSAWWSTMKSLDIPLMLINKENFIIGANNTLLKFLEYSSDSLNRKTLVEITQEDDRMQETNTFIDTFYGKVDRMSISKRFVSESGAIISAFQHCYPIRNEQETLYALVFLSTTELLHQAKESSESQNESPLRDTGFASSGAKISFSADREVIQQVLHLIDKLQTLIKVPASRIN